MQLNDMEVFDETFETYLEIYYVTKNIINVVIVVTFYLKEMLLFLVMILSLL